MAEPSTSPERTARLPAIAMDQTWSATGPLGAEGANANVLTVQNHPRVHRVFRAPNTGAGPDLADQEAVASVLHGILPFDGGDDDHANLLGEVLALRAEIAATVVPERIAKANEALSRLLVTLTASHREHDQRRADDIAEKIRRYRPGWFVGLGEPKIVDEDTQQYRLAELTGVIKVAGVSVVSLVITGKDGERCSADGITRSGLFVAE